MPDRRSIFRLLALAGFLLTVALALWLAELRPLLVIVVMGIALLVAWTVEWLSWRQDQLRWTGDAVEVGEEPAVAPVPPALVAPPAHEHVEDAGTPPPEPRAPVPLEPPAPVPAVEAEPAPAVTAPSPAAEPEPEPVQVPAPSPATPPEPVTVAASEPAAANPAPPPRPPAAPAAEEPPPPSPPEPPRPALRPVPPLAPPPAPPAAPQAAPVRPAAAAPGVVDLRTRVTAQARRWNLWDLERRARDEAQNDPLRYEEWSYLFVHLRQFATPDGSLPVEFDDLVRESFGDLLEHAG
ncbi:MAG TPA: hypothetical protein VD769_14420 [Gaiellaceae bacterium]|nr:hypothetical protein [Gaiellaceae bacterium]